MSFYFGVIQVLKYSSDEKNRIAKIFSIGAIHLKNFIDRTVLQKNMLVIKQKNFVRFHLISLSESVSAKSSYS